MRNGWSWGFISAAVFRRGFRTVGTGLDLAVEKIDQRVYIVQSLIFDGKFLGDGVCIILL